jgi:hypothetical protein
MDKQRPSVNHFLVGRELATHIQKKAYRFAASPRDGYLAGYSPHARPVSLSMDSRLMRVRNWNEKLAWLYAIAEQDIPVGQPQWALVEQEDFAYQVVFDTAYPA